MIAACRRRCVSCWADRRRRGRHRALGTEHGAQQVARCLGGGQNGLRQDDAELPLDAAEQLDAAEAVDAQVPVEHAVESDGHRGAARLQLADKAADAIEQAGGGGVRRTAAGRRFRWCHVRHIPPRSRTPLAARNRSTGGARSAILR